MNYVDELIELNRRATAYDLFGDISGGLAKIQSGIAGRRSADFVADQLRYNAGQAQASAQRAAYNEDRTAKYVASNALAEAASGGGGASDPTVVKLIARNKGEMAYRKQLALYEGDDKARMLNLQADATEYSGKSEQINKVIGGVADIYSAKSTLMKGKAREMSIRQRAGEMSLYERFGGDGPQSAERPDKNWWEL